MQQQAGRSVNGSSLEPMVRNFERHQKLSAADREALLALPCAVRTFERQQFVVRERELATHSCVLLSGFAVRSKIVASGERQILAIHMKGEVVDLQNSLLKVADHSVQMLTAGKVAMIPREEMVRIAFEAGSRKGNVAGHTGGRVDRARMDC